MWGSENWGEMVWGVGVPIPTLGPAAMAALLLALAASGSLLAICWTRQKRTADSTHIEISRT
jgi:hypothetical protein